MCHKSFMTSFYPSHIVIVYRAIFPFQDKRDLPRPTWVNRQFQSVAWWGLCKERFRLWLNSKLIKKIWICDLKGFIKIKLLYNQNGFRPVLSAWWGFCFWTIWSPITHSENATNYIFVRAASIMFSFLEYISNLTPKPNVSFKFPN